MMAVTDRRSFLRNLAGLSLLAASGCGSSSQMEVSRRKPNFVLILVDDLGWADVAFQGSSLHETPNIDRLAAQGMRFTDGYAACPVCSPTRASVQTGKYPARLHLTNFIPGTHRLPYSSVIPPEFNQQLPLEEVTIAEALRLAGYTSASIGKWHLGGDGYLPTDQGYDLNYAGTHSGMPKSFFYPEWYDNPPIHAEHGEYLPNHLTSKAIEFVEEHKDEPFSLYLPFYTVHIPIEAKDEHIEKFKAKVRLGLEPGVDQHDPVYAAMVYAMDENVGRLLDKLDELGIADDTVVFFTSDNGGLNSPEWKGVPVTSNLPLRAGKGHLYEGGVREPFLVRWPGVTDPGSVCRDPVITNDLFPTILEIAGIGYDYRASPVDGVSIVPLLSGSGSLPERDLYWHYPHYSNQLGRPGGAVRSGGWKLIEFYDEPGIELYNLDDDIGEQSDLAESMPGKAAELRAKLDAWRRSVNAVMPEPNPDYDPARKDERVSRARRSS